MVGNQAEILWILLNQTWQTNLLWPMIPQVPEQRWLAFHYTLADEPTLAEHNGKGLKAPAFTVSEIPTPFSQNTCLLRKWLSFIPRAPETSTSKFLGVLNTMAKVWKLQHSLFLRYPQHFLKTHVLLIKWLSFVPRAPEIPTSKFSAVLNTMVGN